MKLQKGRDIKNGLSTSKQVTGNYLALISSTNRPPLELYMKKSQDPGHATLFCSPQWLNNEKRSREEDADVLCGGEVGRQGIAHSSKTESYVHKAALIQSKAPTVRDRSNLHIVGL